MDPANGKKRHEKRKKDVIWTEQTQSFVANKGLSVLKVLKTTSFLMQMSPKRTQKEAKNPPFVRSCVAIRECKAASGQASGTGLHELRI
jgi:hypothetical protein